MQRLREYYNQRYKEYRDLQVRYWKLEMAMEDMDTYGLEGYEINDYHYFSRWEYYAKFGK